MNLLAVGAHPDDTELGCFGTLLEKKKQGCGVYSVALAPGAYGSHGLDEVETASGRARAILREGPGRGDYILGSFQIGRLQHDWATVGFLDDLIKEYDIDTVITHHYGEAHQDHIVAQRVAVSAARRQVDSLLLWESSIYTHRNVFPFRPQVYEGISQSAFEGKMAALEAYQAVGLLSKEEVEAHRHLARYRGAEMHREYAESFEVVWELHDHGTTGPDREAEVTIGGPRRKRTPNR